MADDKDSEYEDISARSMSTHQDQQEMSMPSINDSWFGKPVEEVDPLIFEDTFCVITKKMDKHFIYRFSCSRSLYLMGPLNPVRKLAVYTTTHRWFDHLIILTILCNCVTLAMITNIFTQAGEQIYPAYDYYIDRIEFAFLGIYTIELVLKVISKGLVINKFSYLRNRWNILDFIVVASGYATILQDIFDSDTTVEDNDLDFLRTFRVLRAVKTISILPGLRLMINALMSSVAHLLEVMALIIVCLIIFSLFALELFQGNLRQKCVLDKGGPEDPDRLTHQMLSEESDDDRDRLWTEWVNDWKNWKRRDFPDDEPTQCGNDSDTRQCGPGYTCLGLIGDNPDAGWTCFDNFFASMLSSFQLLTSDYWERPYDLVVSTSGVWSLLFFVIIIFMGSYYLLNLLLAVVTISYENEAQLQDQGPLTATQKLVVNRKQSTFSLDELSKLNICKMTHYRKRTKSEKENLAKLLRGDRSFDKREDFGGRENLHLDDAIFNLLGMRVALEDDDNGPRNSVVPDVLTPVNQGKGRDSVDSHGEKKVAKCEFVQHARRASSGSNVEMDDISQQDFLKKIIPSQTGLQTKMSIYLKHKLRPVVNHRYFETGITVCIILNTVVLAMEHHNSAPVLEEALSIANHCFMAIFTAECIIKILALQNQYFRSGWNIFDMVIVIISYVDLAVADNSNGSRGLSVIRSMRLLRVFKLAQSWITMKVLLNIIFASFGDLGNLTILLMIVIYIFAVMGMQVVGDQYTPAAFDASNNPLKFPRWHWKHFWYAFMMVFRVLCGEWIEPLWDCLGAQTHYIEERGSRSFLPYFKCFAIFLPILIIGNFIVFNLFLALLLNSFDTEELNAQREKELEACGRAENLKNIVGIMMLQKQKEEEEEEAELEAQAENAANKRDSKSKRSSSVTVVEKPVSAPKVPSKNTSKKASHASGAESKARKRFKWAIKKVILHIRIGVAKRAIERSENKMKRKSVNITSKLFLKNPGGRGGVRPSFHHEDTPVSSEVSEDLSAARDCCPETMWQHKYCPCRPSLLHNRKRLRRESMWDKCRGWSVAIVSHPVFEYSILFLIFASSLTLCFEDVYLDSKPALKRILCILNFCFSGAFFIEMILKWFAIGLYGYFTNFWTILDGFIVLVSLIAMYFDITLDTCSTNIVMQARTGSTAANLGALKALRTLRALRPLRAISRWQGMKIVVNSLLHAIPAIFNVLLVCLLFWLVFSIMGVQFFKGQFYRCVDSEGQNVDARVVPNKAVCCAKANTHDFSWVNTVSNYDNVFEGYLSLFQIATFEGWMELMSFSVDAVGIDKQPSIDYQIGYYAFYVIFIIFGSFFALQLFIGVIIDNFNMLKKRYEGSMLEVLLTPTQRNYYIAMKNLGRKKPRPVIHKPKSKFLSFFYYIALSRKLEVLIFIMIFLNMAVEAFEHYRQSMLQSHVMIAFKAFFTSIYVLEALIKILGLGTFYFTVPWNVYDLIIVFASLMDIFLTSDLHVTLPIPPGMLRIVRVFRVGRILRSLKSAQGLRKLLFALTISLPALINIGALLGLITFIYAILGMALFGKTPAKWSIDDVFNFKTFLNSNLMLLRLMTAAGWNEVLDSLTVVDPECGTYRHIECGLPGEPECPHRALVVAYIISYLLLTNQIMINLFIAIILENYVEASDEEDVGIVEDDLEMFYIRWSRYDPQATQFINFSDLSDFLDSLNPPLRIPKPNTMAIVAFNLPIARGNKMHCLDILHALIRHVLGQVDDSPEFRKLQRRMERNFQKQFPNRRLLDLVYSTRRWKIEQNAAILIQRAWRKHWIHKHPSKVPVYAPPTKKKTIDSQQQHPKGEHGGLGHMMTRMADGVKSLFSMGPT